MIAHAAVKKAAGPRGPATTAAGHPGRWHSHLSLRARILVTATAVLIVAMGAIVVSSGHYFSTHYREALQSRSLAIGQGLKFELERLLSLSFTIRVGDLVGFDQQCRDIVRTYEGTRYAMVVDADGRIVAHNDAARVGEQLADAELRRALAAGESTVTRHLDQGTPVYAAAVPVLQGGKPVAAVLVGFDAEVISAKVRQMLMANLAVGVLVLLAGALVLLLTLSAFVTRPLAALVSQITGLHERGEDDSARRVTEQWQDEIGDLARSFNALMQALERTTVSTERLAAEVEERKRAQAVLDERSQDLARSNAELEQLAYVASHDLQEPLRMVASYLQLVEKRYADRLDADGHEFIGYAVDGAKRMQALINDLLAYSRAGARGGPLQPVEIDAVLDTAIANLGLSIGEQQVRIERGRLPTVLGDPTPLVQLFQNLIGNAIKFRSARPPVVRVEGEADGPWWRFSVTDNGIGIDAEYRERVFVLFQRLHGRSEYPGTGIGLAICKRIVERHGGSIWIEDSPGGGTRFVFTLRRGDGAAEPRVSDKTGADTRPVH